MTVNPSTDSYNPHHAGLAGDGGGCSGPLAHDVDGGIGGPVAAAGIRDLLSPPGCLL